MLFFIGNKSILKEGILIYLDLFVIIYLDKVYVFKENIILLFFEGLKKLEKYRYYS